MVAVPGAARGFRCFGPVSLPSAVEEMAVVLLSACFFALLEGSRFLRGFLAAAMAERGTSTVTSAFAPPTWTPIRESGSWEMVFVWIRDCAAGMAYEGELGVGGDERAGDELARPFARILGTPTTADITT